MLQIKKIRQKRGLTQKDVCEFLQISQNTFSQYENNKRQPDNDTLSRIADFFNVSVDYLLERTSSTADWLKENTEYPYTPKLKKIPVLGYVAAGKPILADEHIIDYTYSDIEDDSFEYFALKINDDSMNAARIFNNDVVIVRIQSTCENGDIVIAQIDNTNVTVKRFNRIDNVIQLIPQSFTREFKIQEYNMEKTNIKIIGKVIECKTKF